MNTKHAYGSAFSVTVSGALSATASIPGSSNRIHYITTLSASSEAATAVVVVACGSTTIWQDRIGNAGAYVVDFSQPAYVAGSTGQGSAVTINVTGGSVLRVNLSGYSL